MPAAGVELQVQKQMDNLAAYKKALVAAVAGRVHLWNLAYNVGPVPAYIDVVVNATLFNLDITMDSTTFGANVGAWFSLHQTYFQNNGFPGQNPIDLFITAQKWRAHQYLNQFFIDFNGGGGGLTATNAFPRDDQVLGTLVQVGNVFTPGLQVDPTQAGGGMINTINPAVIGGATFTVTATLLLSTGVHQTGMVVTYPPATPANTHKIFGQQLLTANVAVGATVIPIANTTGFNVGEEVLLQDPTTPNAEWGVVQSIVPNTSITLVAPTRWGYTTANNSVVTPLFFGVFTASAGGGSPGDAVNFGVEPDRVVSQFTM